MEILRSLSITPLTSTGINGDYKVGSDDTAVFFMPHCPEMLYATVLETNEGRLGDVTIVGNDLSSYRDMLRGGSANDVPAAIVTATDPTSGFVTRPLAVVGGGGGGDCEGWKLDSVATQDGRDCADRVYKALHSTSVMRWQI